MDSSWINYFLYVAGSSGVNRNLEIIYRRNLGTDMNDRTRIIADVSSLCWTCLLAGKDEEFGQKVEFEGKEVLVNSWQYGYENLINHFVSVMTQTNTVPMDIILVVEGMNSKLLRQSIFPGYKLSSSRPPQAYEQFGLLRDKLVEVFIAIGSTAVSQDGIESDDVIAYLVTNLAGKKIIDSNDGDLCALISDEFATTHGVTVWKQSKGKIIDENPYGPFPCHHITSYKALVGDASDKLPGAKGFGEKAWLELLCTFGNDGVDLLKDLILKRKIDDLSEDVGSLKALQKVIDNKDMVYKSFDCARLYPEKVNTMRMPLHWNVGMVKPRTPATDERLKHFAGQQRLVSAENFEDAFTWMVSKFSESSFVSYDIETSSNDESDQWLQTAKGKSDGDDIGVDVFGAELTSFSLTFGSNMQYTFYFPVDHVEEPGVTNITKAQAKQVLEAIPKGMINAIQNVAFELPVIMNELGELKEAA